VLTVSAESQLEKLSNNKELAKPLDYVITGNQEDIKASCLFFGHEPDIAESVYSREDN
jgi:hypothetical protein